MLRMAVSVQSRMSTAGRMAVGVYLAITEHGLAPPAQRLIADKCRISAATLSRRLQRHGLEELVELLVDARSHTFPPTFQPTWSDWLPLDEDDRTDARVWHACEDLAFSRPTIASSITEVWQWQRSELARLSGHPDGSTEVAALHAAVGGLTSRLLLDPELDHAAALAALDAVVEGLSCKQRCLHDR